MGPPTPFSIPHLSPSLMRSSLKKRKWVRQEEPGAAVELNSPAVSASTYPRRQPRMCAAFCKKAALSVTIRRAGSQVPVQILSAVSLVASFEVWQLLLVSLKPLPCSHLVTAPCPHPQLAAVLRFKFLKGGCWYTLLIQGINFSRMARVQITPLETKTKQHHHPNCSTQTSSHLLTFGV